MKWISARARAGDLLSGLWVASGSPVVAELAGHAGPDWVLLDWEHGMGGDADMIHCLQALRATPSAPIVRIPGLDPSLVKRVLDRGANGVMIPWVSNADEAAAAVRAMRYPPDGIRGVAGCTPATRFGLESEAYLKEANENLLTIVQIETPQAVDHAASIAAVDGVDILFVGPSDLSYSLGIHRQLEHPAFRTAVEKVLQACRTHGKQAGILTGTATGVARAIEDGFTFIGCCMDTTLLMSGMRTQVETVTGSGLHI